MSAIAKTTSKQFVMPILLWSLLIFLPSNLFLTLTEETAFLGGLRVDYLIPKLYLSQVLIWLGVAVSLIFKKKQSVLGSVRKPIAAWLLIILATIIARQFFTTQPISSLWFVFQVLTNLALTWLIVLHRQLLKKEAFYWAIFASLILQVVLAVFQFTQQKPLLPYYILGEPRFEPYFRMSRHIFGGGEKILAYGSTPHPNILAGVCTIFSLVLLAKAVKEETWQASLRCALALTSTMAVFYMTQSFSAVISLLLGISAVALSRSKKVREVFTVKLGWFALLGLAVLVPIFISQQSRVFPQEPSLTRRAQLNQAAWKMFQDNPIWGVGLNQFTLQLEKYGSTSDISRFVQPVHHVGLLLLAETGLVGAVALALILKKSSRKMQLLLSLLVISPLLFLDHYLYTLQIGQMLLVPFILLESV